MGRNILNLQRQSHRGTVAQADPPHDPMVGVRAAMRMHMVEHCAHLRRTSSKHPVEQGHHFIGVRNREGVCDAATLQFERSGVKQLGEGGT